MDCRQGVQRGIEKPCLEQAAFYHPGCQQCMVSQSTYHGSCSELGPVARHEGCTSFRSRCVTATHRLAAGGRRFALGSLARLGLDAGASAGFVALHGVHSLAHHLLTNEEALVGRHVHAAAVASLLQEFLLGDLACFQAALVGTAPGTCTGSPNEKQASRRSKD